jgi:uncharacterized membrane protein
MATKAALKEQVPSRAIILLLQVLLAAALLISIYLGWISLKGGAVAGCGPESGCDKVLHSRWSRWFGVPVSVPAVLLYGLMLAATLRLTPGSTAAQKRQAWTVLLPAAWAVLGAVVWFATLQLFVIRAVCPFCMTAHACGFLAALLLFSTAPIREAPEKPWQKEKEIYVPPKDARGLSMIALAGVAILVLGQALHRPATFTARGVGSASLQQIHTNRFFEIYQGRFVFNMSEVPMIGSPAAPHAMVSLFDYTCHHCRTMHGKLKELHRVFPDQLAIISLPMPLDNHCNYAVRVQPSAHSNACEYARAGLAVWQANRRVQEQFDDWVFAPEDPPDLPAVHEYAARLVGQRQYESGFTNDWVNKYLQLGINIYATNFFFARQGGMPQLIIGTNLLSGDPELPELYRRLDNQLGLRPTNPGSKPQ